MRSNKEVAKTFQNWVFNVIKEIRLTGSYKDEKQVSERDSGFKEAQIQKLQLENIETATNLLKSIGMLDDRSKLLIQQVSLNSLNSHQLSIEDEKNSECSLSKRVQDLYGINLSVRNNHGLLSNLGKKIKRKYIETYGEEPIQREQYVHGTIRKVNHYTLKHWEECLDTVLKEQFASWRNRRMEILSN